MKDEREGRGRNRGKLMISPLPLPSRRSASVYTRLISNLHVSLDSPLSWICYSRKSLFFSFRKDENRSQQRRRSLFDSLRASFVNHRSPPLLFLSFISSPAHPSMPPLTLQSAVLLSSGSLFSLLLPLRSILQTNSSSSKLTVPSLPPQATRSPS